MKSSSTETNLSSDLLLLMPIYSPTSTGLLNNLPGVTSSSAYGGQAGVGNALLLDGVDTRDPEGGSAWTFFNQNLDPGSAGRRPRRRRPNTAASPAPSSIRSRSRAGTPSPASSRSLHRRLSWPRTTCPARCWRSNPGLGDSAITKKLIDYTVQLGGPIVRNRAFFFANVQRYSATTDPIGPVSTSQDISPRFNGKVTLKPSASDTITVGLQRDTYNVKGRVGFWPSAQASDNQTVEEDAPEWVYNAQWQKTFGASALLEAKYNGYTGYYNLDPVDPSPFTYDADTDEYSGGGGGLYYADRSRNQVQVALTKYADKFGSHAMKFGVEIERSHVRSQYQPYGPAGFYMLAYSGVPAYRVSYGYDVQGDNRRTSALCAGLSGTPAGSP